MPPVKTTGTLLPAARTALRIAAVGSTLRPNGQRPAIAVGPRVGAREERSHRVGVRVMQLYAIEARLLSARGGVGKKLRQHLGQVADVIELCGGDALAIAELERFALGRGEHAR